MDCLKHRRISGADPGRADAGLLAHRAQCPACSAFFARQLALDEKLRAALSVPLPDSFGAPYSQAAPVQSGPGSSRHAWVGIAASLFLGLGLAITAWYSGPRGSLAEDLVAHVEHERKFLVAADEAMPITALDAVLRRSGALMSGDEGLITYARTCLFRGQLVPHLIVQGESGPVTVMILPGVEVDGPSSFSESGYFGTLMPSGKGSIAVIAGETADIEPVAVAISESLRWEI